MKKPVVNEQKGSLFVVASALSYGFICYFGLSIIREGFSPYNTMFWRFVVASIFLFLLLLPKIKKLRASREEITSLLLSGAVFHGSATSLYFLSATYIGSGLATVLLFTHPLTVVIFNRIFYKTQIAKICYISFILIIIGMAFVADIGGTNFNFVGIAIGMLSSVFFGLYIVSGKKNNIDPLLSTFIICCGCIIVCLAFTLLHGSFKIPQTLDIWKNIFGLSIICTAIPILLFLKGLPAISSEKAAIISMIEPPIVMLVGYILLDERISNWQLAGALIIMAAALIVVIEKPGKKKTFAQDHLL